MANSAEIDKAINEQLKETFGSKAGDFATLREKLQKVEYDAYKHKIEHLGPLLKERKALIKDIENFWFDTLMQSHLNPAFIDPQDQEALKSLTDIDVQFESDPRAFTMTLTFADNRFFSDKTLTKKLEVAPNAPRFERYSLDTDLKSAPIKIGWKSSEVDLIKLKPRPKEEAEEYEPLEIGSFFNWFSEESDPMDLNSHMLETYLGAHDIFARLEGNVVDDEDDSADEEDDDEDPNAEIDLEEEESRPRKKKRN